MDTEAGRDQMAVEADALTKAFGDVVAVDGFDLRVRRGEIFGLVGPDGAGKTTTIRLLTAIMLPTSGSAAVLGRDTVAEAEAIKPDIGYMAQRFNLYGDLTVEENLAFFADVFGVTGDERDERIDEALRFAGLEEFRTRRAANLSGGMQKKLALAATLVHQPQVLFLDEPTTGVDPVSRREFWEILTDLHLAGITIFVSTPYMDEAERCSRVGLMFRGNTIVTGTPRSIRELMGGEMLEIQSADLRAARSVLEACEVVREVQAYGDRLHAFVADAAADRPAVEKALADAGIEVTSVRETLPRMEEAFISLIRQQQEARGG
ncbi:MAG: ATP-binding cassette domain-containing protein [Anaerolineae bacterium]|jgi:ABC-2 type transport system ATP-binding protein